MFQWQDFYYLNAPLYKKSVITLGNGKKLTITAKNFSEKNIYIKSCTINGKAWNSSIFKHKDIAQGGTIELELAEQRTGAKSIMVGNRHQKMYQSK